MELWINNDTELLLANPFCLWFGSFHLAFGECKKEWTFRTTQKHYKIRVVELFTLVLDNAGTISVRRLFQSFPEHTKGLHFLRTSSFAVDYEIRLNAFLCFLLPLRLHWRSIIGKFQFKYFKCSFKWTAVISLTFWTIEKSCLFKSIQIFKEI